MASNKPLVLVLGATGRTGKNIVEGLLKSGNFRVAALVRPTSLSKPATAKLRASGVEICEGDVTGDLEHLKKIVAGVEVLISAVFALVIPQQREIFRAAKEAGVKRIIPCDFATPGERGIRSFHDMKQDVREYVKSIGAGYTFIDVGWWMQLYLPLPLRSKAATHLKNMSWQIHEDGEGRNLLTDLNHIGTYVARIIADPRTLNQSVIIREDEVSQNVAHEIGERMSGDGEELKARRIPVSRESVLRSIAEGKQEVAKDPTDFKAQLKLVGGEYAYSMHILHENTLESAKKLGYLDARELYPDIPPHSLEECAKEFYQMEEPGDVYNF